MLNDAFKQACKVGRCTLRAHYFVSFTKLSSFMRKPNFINILPHNGGFEKDGKY